MPPPTLSPTTRDELEATAYAAVASPGLTTTGAFTEPPSHSHSQSDTVAAPRLVSVRQLFSCADRVDVVLMALGSLGAALAGLAQPLQIVLLGDIINSFNPSSPVPPRQFRDDINSVALQFVVVGAIVMVVCFAQVAAWSTTASRQTRCIRSAYAHAILSKDIGWFDVHDPMQLATRIADATVTIHEGMGRKVGDGIRCMSMAVSGITIGFTKGWQLTLVLLAFTPVIAFAAFLSMKALATATQAGIESYAKAGAVAQESLSNIRTVHMFNAIDHFVAKYQELLASSTTAGIKKGLAVGWGTGLMFGAIFCTYAVGLYYGAVQVANDRRDGCSEDGCYDGGRVVTIFFCVILGAMGLGQAGPSVQAIFSARAAAFDVFEVINRKSAIDPFSDEGKALPQVNGKVQFDNVTFAYPSRPDAIVCRSYSLTVEAGESVALVGPSGSGKSSIISLLERFYDPMSGSVMLDGVDLRDLNVQWLRRQVGLVSQEPVLFATSIMENIRHGSPGSTDEQVIEAAKMANAYDFISQFPNGFQTVVGERGSQLSGGQKQRIAIARAIIKNPPILLLDEATSALDSESELIVQESLERLITSSKRTTIIVAHRLSTIRNVDKIVVHNHGAIVELGSHEKLVQIPNGQYRQMVEAQNGGSAANVSATSSRLNHQIPSSSSVTAAANPGQTGAFQDHDRRRNKVTMKEDDSDTSASDNSGDADQAVSRSRIWKMILPDWKFLAAGSFGALLNATAYPLWGVLLTKMVVLFFEPMPRDDFLESARYWSLGFLGLAIVFACSFVIQNYGFAVVSQRLTTRVRLATFRAMLQQEVGWFDLPGNSSGALVTCLATDSATLQAMTSDTLNQGLLKLSTIGISLGISFYYSWEMTLLMLATLPILAFSAYIRGQMMSGTISNSALNDADTAAGAMLSEAIGSIRTVASLRMEKMLTLAYTSFLSASKAVDTKGGIVGGVAFGVSQGIMFFLNAFLFYMGGIWVDEARITFQDMFMVIFVITVTMMGVSTAAPSAADMSKVKNSVRRVFKIIDRLPAIDSIAETGDTLFRLQGDIEFKTVHFAYPSRPDSNIYSDFNLKIAAGQTVAIVGASGSGKSTAISLLERFYDPDSGCVTLDGQDISTLQLPWLRERISLVSQEPVLFAGSIAENIAMGKPGATRDEVIAAAKMANAFDFIANFPSGFDTEVGDRGAQVSGGQKQRIAIARAILRDPDVLLLDEATSALDAESERVVQSSLDRLLRLKKRTTIIVAHRLSTVRNADLIAVTKDGVIVEQGTHEELMSSSGGAYRALVSHQVGA